MTKKKFPAALADVIESIADGADQELFAMTADEVSNDWWWKWDDKLSVEGNTYEFFEMLELHRCNCEQWESHHNGSICVVERVRDKYLLPRIHAFLAQKMAKEQEQQFCEWTADSDGVWETACGNSFVFNEGKPRENGFKFCPYCGKQLKQAKGVEMEEQDIIERLNEWADFDEECGSGPDGVCALLREAAAEIERLRWPK